MYSVYGMLEPTMRSVSHPIIRSQEGSRPIGPIPPVTNGRSSGTAAMPKRALATPAPRRSAASITSSVAPEAPAPTRMATLSPELSTSAARSRSSSRGKTRGSEYPAPEKIEPCACGGCSTAWSSWTS